MATFSTKSRGSRSEEAHWISMADLMTGLMIVFLLLAIVLLRQSNEARKRAEKDRETVENVIRAWVLTKERIYDALDEEFREDLGAWDAEIDANTLTFRFSKPEILFELGKDKLRPRFDTILQDFVPRYVEVLSEFYECPADPTEPEGCIKEIRIEGHTSSEWADASQREAYARNMKLSQDRARTVLAATLDLTDAESDLWFRKRAAAVGFSSSRAVLDETGAENAARSRRVDFRIETEVEAQLIALITRDGENAEGEQP